VDRLFRGSCLVRYRWAGVLVTAVSERAVMARLMRASKVALWDETRRIHGSIECVIICSATVVHADWARWRHCWMRAVLLLPLGRYGISCGCLSHAAVPILQSVTIVYVRPCSFHGNVGRRRR